jgi:hypothetical protein
MVPNDRREEQRKIVVLDSQTLVANGKAWAALLSLGEVEAHEHGSAPLKAPVMRTRRPPRLLHRLGEPAVPGAVPAAADATLVVAGDETLWASLLLPEIVDRDDLSARPDPGRGRPFLGCSVLIMDVVAQELIRPDNSVLSACTCLITPHLA